MATIYFTTNDDLLPNGKYVEHFYKWVPDEYAHEWKSVANNARTKDEIATGLTYRYMSDDDWNTLKEEANEIALADEHLLDELDANADEYAMAAFEATNEVDMDMTVDTCDADCANCKRGILNAQGDDYLCTLDDEEDGGNNDINDDYYHG